MANPLPIANPVANSGEIGDSLQQSSGKRILKHGLRQRPRQWSQWSREDLRARFRKVAYIYREEPFQLFSGRTSRHYFDCKRATLLPEFLYQLACYLRDHFIPQALPGLPQAAGGLSMGADPLAYALSFVYWEEGRELYPVVVRKATKEHGTRRRVETTFEQKEEVLLLDDVITTGASSLQAAEAMREAGYTVGRCLSIVEREEGGRAALERQGIELHSLFRGSEFYADRPP